MKVIQINTFSYKATGNIMMNLHHELTHYGHTSYVAWARGRATENEHEIMIGNQWDVITHGILSRLTDRTGLYSTRATKNFIQVIDSLQPDIVHLHNIHGYYINYELLFNYLRAKRLTTVWTFHDCWPFTGHCAYFDIHSCAKWQEGCHHCPAIGEYPKSFCVDHSSANWAMKRLLFPHDNLTIVTPSKWLAGIVSRSFFNSCDIKVIHNGIDLNVFQPKTFDRQEIESRYHLSGKPCILGVAHEWTERKGLKDFMSLAQLAADRYQLLLVGLTDRQIRDLPKGITGIKATRNRDELTKLYTYASLFYNPTYEDNFPTTNIEAIACGTPVLTYQTGGSPEAILEGMKSCNATVGQVIPKSSATSVDIHHVISAADNLIAQKSSPFFSDSCRKVAALFNAATASQSYLNLYKTLTSENNT